MMKLILASQSPRRRDILTQAAIPFEIVVSDVEEMHESSLAPANLCVFNAMLKAQAVAKNHAEAFVLGADTLVFLGNEPLGKPKDFAQAREMLLKLSGQKNEVITGISLYSPNGNVYSAAVSTLVYFKKLNEEIIDEYFSFMNPLDKAGAYAIQEHGELIIDRIEGPLDNVVGLPLAAVKKLLASAQRDLAEH